MKFDIFFEYADGGTDHKVVEATSVHAAARDFNQDYDGERYVLSVTPLVPDARKGA